MRRNRNHMVVCLLSTWMFLAFAAIPAKAQEEKKEEKPIVLPPVTVTAPYRRPAVPDRATTATKTDTPLKDIPASIQVVPKERLADQGAYSLDGVLKNVSGATQGPGTNYGFFNFYNLRGLQQKFLRDGVPDGPSINGIARTLTDVERVEVLKGPGSALYGRAQPGGLVNLVSKQPLDAPLYSLYQSGGFFGTSLTSIDLGGPIGTKELLYRFNGAYYTSDGFRDLGNTTIEILPTVTWRPNEWHTLTLDFDYRNLDIVPDNAGIPFRGDFILDVPLDTKFYTPFSDTDQEVFRGAINYELRLTDDLVVRNNLVVLRRDLFLRRNSGGRVKEGSIKMDRRRLREETNLATDIVYQIEPVWNVKTGTIQHTLLGGFEFQHLKLDAFRQRASLPDIANVFDPVIPETSRAGLVFSPRFDREIEANQFGLYVQDQMEFSEQWKARVGVRFDRFDAEDVERVKSTRRSRSDDRVSANVGLVYQPIPSTSFYAAFSRSHLPVVSGEGAGLKPETATQWEVGNKSTFLDGRISATLALFQATREDFLRRVAPFFDFETSIPVGEQRTRGVELDLASEPLPGWQLSGNYAFLDAELTKLDPANKASEGNRPEGVQRHSAAFWTTYEIQSGPLRGLGFGGGLTFKGSVFNDRQNNQRIPSYTLGDLVLFYRRGLFEARVNFNNVTDTDYFTNGLFGSAAPGEPLTVQGTVQVVF
ncbi:MAG: TonB-dependent siderophore receptor [Candidatus Methylomirabilales bacterium]